MKPTSAHSTPHKAAQLELKMVMVDESQAFVVETHSGLRLVVQNFLLGTQSRADVFAEVAGSLPANGATTADTGVEPA